MEKVELPSGLVVILNNAENFQDDVKILSSLFSARKYRVIFLNNLNQLENTEKYKKLILFFFGYGYGKYVFSDKNQETIMSYEDLHCFLSSEKFGFSQIALLSEVYLKPRKLDTIRGCFTAELENFSHIQLCLNEMQPISMLRKCLQLCDHDRISIALHDLSMVLTKETRQYSKDEYHCLWTQIKTCTDFTF